MATILLLYDKPSLLISSMENLFKSMNHYVVTGPLTMKFVQDIDEKQDAVVIYADEDLSDNTETLVYVKDKVIEDEIGLFAAGSNEELETLRKVIPDSVLQGKFLRPINVKNVAEVVNAFLCDEKRIAKKKVLVVDDSGAVLRNVKSWLEDKYDVVLANSGAQALRYLAIDRPDLVLLDYEMPVADGRQVLEMMRSEIAFQDIPVIFLTSKADKQSVISVMSLRPEGYLLKTMQPSEIVKAVDDFFEKRRIEKLNV